MTTPASLRGKVILITGPARGIGEATARLAAAQGARLALVGLEPEKLAQLAAELAGDHVWFECDVTNQEQLETAVAGTVAALGGIDVVVANAGIANNGTVATNDVEAVVRTIEVNLIGVARTVSATLPHIFKSRGYFLLVASTASFSVLPGMVAYCASKAGVEQFGNALRLEVAHRGVAVGTAHPGWIDTDLVRDQREELATFDQARDHMPWPLNRTISANECAAAFINGIARRKRRVYVPRAIALLQAIRTITLSPLGDALLRPRAAKMVPQLERDVARLGRAFGRHSVGAEKPKIARAPRLPDE